jgi:hypothetical protein
VFALFDEAGVALKPNKCYLGYPSTTLLGQRVNSLGLATDKEKIEAIRQLRFPSTLRELETYLGLTGWLRQYVPYYSQIVAPLQARKTMMLRNAPSGNRRKKFTNANAVLSPSVAETNAFNTLQARLSQPTYLVHFNPSRRLYIDVDASKSYGFGSLIYHVKDEVDPISKDGKCLQFKRSDIEPIMLLSKSLTEAERRYWPTELEMAGLVWVVRKVRHLVEASPKTTIFTDHAAATSIAKQVHLSSANTDKLNLRLIRASQYLSQFDLDVRYRPGRIHLVPDALSRLLHGMEIANKEKPDDNVLDNVGSYHLTLVELSPTFKASLRRAYQEDPLWSRLLHLTKPVRTNPVPIDPTSTSGTKPPTSPPQSPIRFHSRDDLLYFRDTANGREKLCVPARLEKEVFRLAHDLQHHVGFHRAYERIAPNIYIRQLAKRLRTYIEHCPECQVNQTKRHRPYGSLQPIHAPPIPFYTITMDFVVALPEVNGVDALLTITDKFSKRVLLLPGHTTHTTEDWANITITSLLDHDWGIPAAIISDRDPKFLSSFWRAVFTKMGTSLLTSTAYHPQSDGQSERTNQVVEIALRYHASEHPEDAWTTVLPYLQATMNNSTNATTGQAPNEIIYGFKTRDVLGMLADLPPEDYTRLRQI